MTKVLLLLGAGATVSDVATRSKIHRPPLDKGFFSLAHAAGNTAHVERIAGYMERTYAVNIRDPVNDSLEQVMGQIYTDQLNPVLKAKARPAFLSLLRLFNERLATTTNNIAATQKRFVYRILSYYLSEGVHPRDITVLTFNQDLQAEKTLELLATKAKWKKCAQSIFNFPGCYGLPIPDSRVTGPTRGASPSTVFPLHPKDDDCLRVLKLRGSLNWYSKHTSQRPSTEAMFRPTRRLSITRRRDVYVDMTVAGPSRKSYAIPVVIPPVTHKSSVLHNDVRDLWATAEQRLTDAEHLVIFGYSCPPLDFEATNMLRRSQHASTRVRTISLVDPDPTTATRYIALLQPSKLAYYPSADAFLTDHPH